MEVNINRLIGYYEFLMDEVSYSSELEHLKCEIPDEYIGIMEYIARARTGTKALESLIDKLKTSEKINKVQLKNEYNRIEALVKLLQKGKALQQSLNFTIANEPIKFGSIIRIFENRSSVNKILLSKNIDNIEFSSDDNGNCILATYSQLRMTIDNIDNVLRDETIVLKDCSYDKLLMRAYSIYKEGLKSGDLVNIDLLGTAITRFAPMRVRTSTFESIIDTRDVDKEFKVCIDAARRYREEKEN